MPSLQFMDPEPTSFTQEIQRNVNINVKADAPMFSITFKIDGYPSCYLVDSHGVHVEQITLTNVASVHPFAAVMHAFALTIGGPLGTLTGTSLGIMITNSNGVVITNPIGVTINP